MIYDFLIFFLKNMGISLFFNSKGTLRPSFFFTDKETLPPSIFFWSDKGPTHPCLYQKFLKWKPHDSTV